MSEPKAFWTLTAEACVGCGKPFKNLAFGGNKDGSLDGLFYHDMGDESEVCTVPLPQFDRSQIFPPVFTFD